MRGADLYGWPHRRLIQLTTALDSQTGAGDWGWGPGGGQGHRELPLAGGAPPETVATLSK